MNDTITRPYMANRPTTEFGLVVVGDMPNPDAWWAERDDRPMGDATASDERQKHAILVILDETSPTTVVDVVPTLDEDEATILRPADFAENGRAYWIGALGVVSIEVDDVQMLANAAAWRVERQTVFHEPNRYGWDRVSPSAYGIQVESFEGGTPPIEEAWEALDEACKRV